LKRERERDRDVGEKWRDMKEEGGCERVDRGKETKM